MTPPAPRVLYLSFYFPPSRASGVYRARATANHLAARGWDVTVMAAPLRFLYEVNGSVDEELAATVDPRIRVERPELDYYPWESDLRRFGRLRGLAPTMRRKLYEATQRRAFPERYASWGMSAVRRAVAMHARRRFDVVLATGNPFASFAAAWLINRATRIPYVIDYRDSWTLDLFNDVPAFPESHPAWTWERRAIGAASATVFVNDALRGWRAQRYPAHADRMLVVPNGWDPDLMPTVDPPVMSGPATTDGVATDEGATDEAATNGAVSGAAATDGAPAAVSAVGERRPLRFGYLGTLTNAQPVDVLGDAFRLARKDPDLADAELHIHGHIGFFRSSPVEAMLERLGVSADADDAGIRYRGPVSKTDVASVYRECDVLVFLAGGARYITSGKIFEYMATGRPIVSVHGPDIAAREVLAGYPLWFNANSLDVEEVAQSMIAAGAAARALTPEQHAAARRHAGTYTRDNMLVPLEARLRELVRRPRALTAGDGTVVR